MQELLTYLPLIGIVIVIVGFALRWNSILIVLVAAFVTGLLGKMDVFRILHTIGNSFVANRAMAVFLVILPIIGLLEKNGLRETAARLISKIDKATPNLVISAYGILRSILASFNIGLGGVAGFVRPVIYPMALASVEKNGVKIDPKDDDEIKGMAASMENVTWFFGQALFIGGGGVLLVQSTLKGAGYDIDLLKAVQNELPVIIIALIVAITYYTIRCNRILKKYAKGVTNNDK